MILVPLLPVYIDKMTLQKEQWESFDLLKMDGYSEYVASLPNGYALLESGEAIICGGVIPQGDGRGLAWSLISEKMHGAKMIAATRAAQNCIDNSGFRRVECIVRDGFQQGFRWARMLGFTCETPEGMINWYPNGGKAFLFARGF